MTDPFDPRRGDGPDAHEQHLLEEQLRRSLAARARDVPDADALTQRLLAAELVPAAGRPGHGTRRWSTWTTPLVAAACVAAIVGIVLAVVGLGGSGGHGGHGPDAAGSASLPQPLPPQSSPVTAASWPDGSITSPASPTSVTPTSTPAPVHLTGVHVLDLTFTGHDTGWALASAQCINGSATRCTALLHTTDGSTWTAPSGLTSPFDVADVGGCPAERCVDHVRFADDSVGYAFGPHALFLTVDGGVSWRQMAGGADALEIADNTVIRVSVLSGSPSLQVAPVGGTSWTAKSVGGLPSRPTGVSLSRTGHLAIIAVSRLDAPAGEDAHGAVLRSTDDGATWTLSAGDPCARAGGGTSDVLATATTSADGAVVLGCAAVASDGASQRQGRVLVSTDGGRTLSAPAKGRTPTPARLLAAASASAQLAVPTGGGAVYRTADAGQSWTPVSDLPSGAYRFLGFESASVGRLVSASGRTIWTTRDGGLTWQKVSV